MTDETNFPGNSDGKDPLERWLSQFGMSFHGSQPDLNQLLSQLQQAMAQSGPTSIWNQARSEAQRKLADLGEDPQVDSADQEAAYEAYRLANNWLDQVMTFDALDTQPATWTRSRWIDETMDTWRRLGEPISSRIGAAYAASFDQEVGGADGEMPEQMAQFSAMLAPMLEQSAQAMYAQQSSGAIATLASQVLTGSEIGFQALTTPRVVLMPTSVKAFSADLGGSPEDIRIYLMLRESARQRLFAAVGWLGPQMLAMVEHYAREIVIDARALSTSIDAEELNSLTPQKIQEMAEALQGKLFSPTTSPQQEEILGRLETLLALVEGWVDYIVSLTAGKWMPHAAGVLDEAIRRRRATDDPARRFFKTLVGLDLSPRRVRDAFNLWSGLTESRGFTGRDALWTHPDLMPVAADLDDPIRLIHPEQQTNPVDEMDAALAALLDQAERERREDPSE